MNTLKKLLILSTVGMTSLAANAGVIPVEFEEVGKYTDFSVSGLTDADGKVVLEGEETISDISFDFNILAPIRTQTMSFFYEINMLEDWIRKTFRSLRSNTP